MSDETKDYYKILGVPEDATADQIRKAYKKLAIKWHPDKNQDNKEEAEEKFKEINEAYTVLSDPEKKRQWEFSKNGGGSFNFDSAGFDPFANFDSFFKDFGFGFGDEDDDFFNMGFGGRKKEGGKRKDPFGFGGFGGGFGGFGDDDFGFGGGFGGDCGFGGGSTYTKTTTTIINGKKVTKTETVTVDKDGNKKVITSTSGGDNQFGGRIEDEDHHKKSKGTKGSKSSKAHK